MVSGRFQFALVGTGMIAHFHARALGLIPDVAGLAAVVSRDPARAEAFAREFGCEASGNLAALLAARPEIDAVLVATPSGAHLGPVLAAAAAGRHALCEKPLEVSCARIDRLIAAHRTAGTRLGCIFQNRYLPVLGPVRAALASGRLGKLTGAIAEVPWWRDDSYYSGSPWHGTKALDGGGALMNQAIHTIDLLLSLAPPVAEVRGFCSSAGHPGIETEDAAVAALRFEGGAVGMVYGTTSSWPGRPRRIELTGTEGTIVLRDNALEMFAFRRELPGDEAVRRRFGGAATAAGAASPSAAMTPELHAACFRDFVNACRTGAPFSVSGEEARKSVALIERLYRAALPVGNPA